MKFADCKITSPKAISTQRLNYPLFVSLKMGTALLDNTYALNLYDPNYRYIKLSLKFQDKN